MANTVAPFGFRQVSGTGASPTFEQNVRKIASGNATAIFFGDAVVPLTSGYITQITAAAAVQVAGIFLGCKYLSTAQKRTVWSNYWPGSDTTTDVEAYICDDPNSRWVVQGSTAALVFADIGSNIDVAVGTGNTATGVSGMSVAQGTLNTTNTLPFRIEALVTDPPGANGTDITTVGNYVIVSFANLKGRLAVGV